jgi:hypothetical protein
MPRSQPIKWDEITVLPDSSSALLASGYITRDLLPLIEGQTRQVQAKCHLCDKVFPPIAAIKHNQTSNWLNHLRDKHTDEFTEVKAAETQATSSNIGAESSISSPMRQFIVNTRETTNQELRKLVLLFIVEANLPIRAIDAPTFQEILRYLRAPGTINRKLIGQEITTYYQNRKIEIISSLSYLQENGAKFSLCLDCWTSKTQHAFLGVSIHYINDKWQQESFLLDLADLYRRHSGDYLCRTLIKVLKSYNIDQSILAITRDNASNNHTLLEGFQEHYDRSNSGRKVYSIPCVDHVLNLVCQAILKKLKATISESEIQELAIETQVIEDSEVERQEREAQLGLAQAPRKRRKTGTQQTRRRTKIIPPGLSAFQKIRFITGKLRQQQHLIRSLERNITRLTSQNTGLKLPRPTLDMPVRWNSTYVMLRNFSQSRRPIEAVMRHYKHDFKNLEITEADWSIISELRQALGQIATISDFF